MAIEYKWIKETERDGRLDSIEKFDRLDDIDTTDERNTQIGLLRTVTDDGRTTLAVAYINFDAGTLSNEMYDVFGTFVSSVPARFQNEFHSSPYGAI